VIHPVLSLAHLQRWHPAPTYYGRDPERDTGNLPDSIQLSDI